MAVHILGEAAKASCSTLRTLLNLARGIRPKAPDLIPEQDYSGEMHLLLIIMRRILDWGK